MRFSEASAHRAQVPGAKVEAVPLDLASLASVRAFAQKCLDGGRELDVLVNNAGEHAPHTCMDIHSAAELPVCPRRGAERCRC